MKIVYVGLLVLIIVAPFVTYVSWPSNDSKENVNNPDSELENLERKDCMEKLYDGYVLKQLNVTVDGKQTVRENIGDLIGLKRSYRAYEKFAKDSEEPLLPSLNYTARQWFWINAATTFCSYESDVALWNIIKTNVHSPTEARVNVAFASTDEFSRDFECPIGSRMNPVRKCGFQ